MEDEDDLGTETGYPPPLLPNIELYISTTNWIPMQPQALQWCQLLKDGPAFPIITLSLNT